MDCPHLSQTAGTVTFAMVADRHIQDATRLVEDGAGNLGYSAVGDANRNRRLE
jgi:hypothetical protein